MNGGWSTWGPFDRCNSKCNRMRRRVCNRPTPDFGGRPCPGLATQKGKYNTCSCVHLWKYIIWHIKRYYQYKLSISEAPCGADKYPRKMACINSFSCAALAKTKACSKRFNQALPKWCADKLTLWYRKQFVKNYCRKSCKNC